MAGYHLLIILLSLFLHLPLPLSSSSSSFTPIFLACGSLSNVTPSGEKYPRTFTPDDRYLNSLSTSNITFVAFTTPLLYSNYRVFNSFSYYSFDLLPNAYYILRLHFYSFQYTSSARFSVSANHFPLLSSFSAPPPSSPSIKEFLLWVDTSSLYLTFSPAPNFAFISALELISSPSNLTNGSHPFYITAFDSSPMYNFLPQAMETVYRVNVGGSLITPANDTLWRTWETDDDKLLFNEFLSLKNSTSGIIEYPTENGPTEKIAPSNVYSTARTMNITPVSNMNSFNFNLTWSFNASPGLQYLVRMHFCNCWFPNQTRFFFEVYLGGFAAPVKQMNWPETMMIPFYIDFVVDAPVSGPLNISIGLDQNSKLQNAFLNGLEIMKLDNSLGHGKNKHLLAILLPSVLSGLILLLVLLFAYLLWSHHNGRAEAVNNSASPLPNFGLQIPIADVLFATNNFDEKLLIGAGGFGKVYKGLTRYGTKVAVKRGVPGSQQGYPEFQTEIILLSRIRHRHIVSLIGYCNEQSEMILVYEYMEKGTLRSYLYGSDLPCLSWKQRLEICIGAAKGLHHLHTGDWPSIIHRDVKTSNILLNENLVAKVSDFGISRVGPSLVENHISTSVKGTFGYLDPEYFKKQKLTEKSDIYSFGVVLFEVLCSRPAIDNHVSLAELALYWQKKGKLKKIVDQRLAGMIKKNSLRMFGETAAKCLADYGEDRPRIGDVLRNLEYALQLQETRLRRELSYDCGIVDESQIAVVELVRRVPSTGILVEEVPDITIEVLEESAGSKDFENVF